MSAESAPAAGEGAAWGAGAKPAARGCSQEEDVGKGEQGGRNLSPFRSQAVISVLERNRDWGIGKGGNTCMWLLWLVENVCPWRGRATGGWFESVALTFVRVNPPGDLTRRMPRR